MLQLLPPVLLLAAIVLVWYASVAISGVPDYVFPPPGQVFQALLAHGWSYLPDVWTTTQEILAGFALGLAAAVPLALGIGRSEIIRRALYPILISTQMVPIFAIAAILTISFAYGLLPQIIVAALYSFFPIVVTTADGLTRVDTDLLDLMRASGASEWQTFRTIRIPSALPSLFSGAKLAITFAVGGAVIGEWIGGQSGLGYYMRFQNNALDVPGMFATILVMTLLGVALFVAVNLVEYVALPWSREEHRGLGALWRGQE